MAEKERGVGDWARAGEAREEIREEVEERVRRRRVDDEEGLDL